VASEVKALAEQSKKATAQVRQILGDIQKATNSAVLATEDSTKSASPASLVYWAAPDRRRQTARMAGTSRSRRLPRPSDGRCASSLGAIIDIRCGILQPLDIRGHLCPTPPPLSHTDHPPCQISGPGFHRAAAVRHRVRPGTSGS
jgi:hypothetical protein